MRPCGQFPAYPPELVPSAVASFTLLPTPRPLPRDDASPRRTRSRHVVRQLRAVEWPHAPAPAANDTRASAPWEHPLVVGALLLAAPPVGIAALWGSARFAVAGKIAVTAFVALAMLCAAAVAAVYVANS